MILEINDLLSGAEVKTLLELYGTHNARDGGQSAGSHLSEVKRNQELDLGTDATLVKNLVLEALNRKPNLNYALLPRMVTTPILSRYQPGMTYGGHIDSAFGTVEGRVYRNDLSCTIFLDDPAQYTGGELWIETDSGTRSYKLPPGHAVFYPTWFLHGVAPVSSGQRRACIYWIESLIRDAGKRSLLFELTQVSTWMADGVPQDANPHQTLVKIRENLFRMWLET